jgi:probable selenium-dependent hydroxylase accessory protein YqeC
MSFSTRADRLSRALGIDEGALVALCGSGGKTTTMLRLAATLQVAREVLVTTTTKIWPVPGVHTFTAETEAEAREQLVVRPGTARLITLARSAGMDGKLHGVPPGLLSALAGTIGRIILCEADGAAGRPLKVHGPGEPVIPRGATHVLVIAGIDCVGRIAGPDTVHRINRYEEVTGGAMGQPIKPAHVARALAAGANFAPAPASLFFLLNKLDSPADQAAAEAIADELRLLRSSPRIFITHRGDLVDDLS